MIIEIDGYFFQVLLTGKKCSKQQLKQKYQQSIELTNDIKDLHNVFCRLHNFEQIPYDCDIKVEFVIDTDTDRIYSPSY
ncbi:hypothetical protein [Neobacillus sp. PS2-9]|uniref:hypothetical protein n=1 Tax=Neobacillus sp. PS2-9 TaxID=3070676 RepID=UPI0027E1D80A|nr:hypothetical protein [Neobacillus sp. PS2-9]WML60754.1 hypothetical protein RCG25_14210 [Neobacillus sp. PS2-9]